MDLTPFISRLEQLEASANLRRIPDDTTRDAGLIDLTSNDYLGIAARTDWQEEFLDNLHSEGLLGKMLLTSSASRMLAANQHIYADFESLLSGLYDGRAALLLNSGYHANSGIIPAICSASKTRILADRLVHASIIDGIMLSKAQFTRFRHNDFTQLERLVAETPAEFDSILVVVESVYSMDGDTADIDALIDIRRRYPRVILYVDEAHGVGVCGKQGRGLVSASKAPEDVDVVVGTLGKALASQGAFVITGDVIRDYLVNTTRSLIFSTSIPPINVAWSQFTMTRMLDMDAERQRLQRHAQVINRAVTACSGDAPESHIQPLIIGNSPDTLRLSKSLREAGVKVLPIRTPTVPPGTERLRISLSASLTDEEVARAAAMLQTAFSSL